MAKEEENMELSFPEIFDILDCSMEDMLDVLSQAIDMLEEGKGEDALEVLKALEEDMFDFLGYVDEGSLSDARVISTLIELKQIFLSKTPKGSPQ